MQWFKQNFSFVIILILILVIIFQRGCESSPKTIEKVVTKIETKYDTVVVKTAVYVPKYIYKTVVDIDTFSTPIDTVEILKDYYAQYHYKDSLVNDSIKFYINDVISRNRVLTRDLSYSIIVPHTTITNVITQNKRELYAGFGLVGTTNSIINLGPELMYKNKKDQAYGLGLGVNSDLQPSIGFRMYWKLHLGK